MKDFRDFVRAVYKAATPSVDFDAAERIECTKHTIRVEDYEKLLDEFAGSNVDARAGCGMWMVCSGPKLID